MGGDKWGRGVGCFGCPGGVRHGHVTQVTRVRFGLAYKVFGNSHEKLILHREPSKIVRKLFLSRKEES